MIELAAAFGDRAAAELYAALLPHAARLVCGGAGVIVVEGSTHPTVGIGAATLDRRDDAVAHLRTAVEINSAAGRPPAAATARYHLAHTLGRHSRASDRDTTATLAATVVTRAGAMGMRPLRAAAAALAPAAARAR